jgi:hypothetical protein
MSMIGGGGSSFKVTNQSTGPIDKVGVGAGPAGESGAAEGASASAPVGGVDVAKIANEVAQTLTSAADKFKMLAGVNPFSQKAGMMMDMLTKGHDTIQKALDEWGKSIRHEAHLDKEADLKSQLLKKPIEKSQVLKEDISKRFGV